MRCGVTDLNEDKELDQLDTDITELRKTNLFEESLVIKLKAETACLESRVTSSVIYQYLSFKSRQEIKQVPVFCR